MPQGPTSQQLEITLQTIARMYLTLGIIRSASARKLFGSITLSFTYSHFYFDPKVSTAHKNDWINVCGKLLEDGTVTCVVDKVYDWSDINEAIDYMKTQRAQGKIVLKVEKF